MKRIRLWWLKHKARRVYMNIDSLWDTYDGGRSTINMLTGGRLDRLESELERLMVEVKRLSAELGEVP